MPSRLFALLVGINAYPDKPLKGCVRDAEAFAAFLREIRADAEVELLLDAEATRTRIIESFRRHLGQARAGDVAVFVYSGHGSREIAPPPYAAEEPGGLSETLVAYDSREDGKFDLADKEMAALIGEVEARGAHVVVLLDSCFSGTATRDEGAVRRYDRADSTDSRRVRRAGTYWFEDPAAVPEGLLEAGGFKILPRGPHVLLAACQDNQTAREDTDGDRPCGLFSLLLLQSLRRLGPAVSYRQWIKDVEARVMSRHPEQRPEGNGELDRLVFDGTTARRAVTFHLTAREGTWELDAGFLHGLKVGSELAVFPSGTADLRDLEASSAVVRLIEVGISRSRIEIVDRSLPEPEGALPAVLTYLPFGLFGVALDLPREERRNLAAAIERSPFLRLTDRPEEIAIRVSQGERDGDPWRLWPPGETGGLSLPEGPRKEWPRVAVGALEQVARCHALANLDVPSGGPQLDAEMTLLRWVSPPAAPGDEPVLEEMPPGIATLPYRDGQPGRFSIRLKNRGDVTLYCALLNLTEAFAIRRLQASGGERLEPGDEIVLRKWDGIPATVPEGVGDRRRDLLLLLASEEKVDFSLLDQGKLFDSYPRRDRPVGRPRSILDSLLWRMGHRDLDDAPRPLWAFRWGTWRQWIVAER